MSRDLPTRTNPPNPFMVQTCQLEETIFVNIRTFQEGQINILTPANFPVINGSYD